MRQLTLTITGNVATDVTETRFDNGDVTATFRVASNSRYYDQAKDTYTDRKTEFFTVYVRRALARHVIDSVHKGEPVVVVGRLGSNEWTSSEGESKHSMTLQADAVGHDLSYGTSEYSRSARRAEEPMVDEKSGEILDTDALAQSLDGELAGSAPF